MRTRKTADRGLVEAVYKTLGQWDLGPDRDLDCRVCYAVGYDWTSPYADCTWREHVEKHGFAGAWLTDHVYGRADGVPELTNSFDAVWEFLMDMMPRTDHVNVSLAGPGVGAEVGVWVLGRPEDQGGPYIAFHAKESHYDPVLALLAATLKSLLLRLEKGDW